MDQCQSIRTFPEHLPRLGCHAQHQQHAEPNNNYAKAQIQDLMRSSKFSSKLLANNPLLLHKLIEYNKVREDIELLQFINMEQNIMNEDMIVRKLPELVLNIQAIKQEIMGKQQQIAENEKKAAQTSEQIQRMKAKIANKYNQNRQNIQKTKQIQSQIQKLKSLKTKNTKQGPCQKKNSKPKDKTLQNENIDESNYQLENPNNHSVEILKKVDITSNNMILTQKINKMKQQIRSKMMILDQNKKLRKNLTNQINSHRNVNKSSRMQPLVKSQFNSVVISEDTPNAAQHNQ